MKHDMQTIEQPWSRDGGQVMSALETCAEDGFASAEAARRLRACGFKRLRRRKPKTAVRPAATSG